MMKANARPLTWVLLLVLLLLLTPAAYADAGPKPSLTITVVNAPEGPLYVDLLIQAEPTDSPYLSPEEEARYDPALLARLRSLEGDGWVLAYSSGGAKSPPVFGSLEPDENGTWYFYYSGLPQTFRVAAASAQGAQAAEQPYTRSFVDSIIYDWQTNTVRAVTPPPLRFLLRLLATLLPTLLVEGGLLFLFGFREKRSWVVFLLVNVATQVGLHLYCGAWLAIAGSHLLFYFLLLFLPELVIWGVEAVLFALLLRERSLGRRIGYALCANAASFLLGYIPTFLLTILAAFS